MKATLKISIRKSKLSREKRFAGIWACAFAVVCLSGCPEQQKVTVTVKTSGAAADTADGGTAAETVAKGYGALQGTITFDGTPPTFPPLVPKGDASLKPADKAVCAAADVPNESLVVNSSNKGLANAVIFLEKRPANIKPELAKPSEDPVVFDQKQCRFLPHVLVFEAGRPMLIKSGDPITHNTHTSPKRNKGFNQSIPPDDRAGVECNYKTGEPGPLPVICDVHTWMKAYHFPVDHPYFAVTDENGKYRIEGLPAGKHVFKVWHERGPGDNQLLERKLEVTIEVDGEATKDLNYGAAKFAGMPQAPARSIAYSRLLQGGTITLTQSETRN